MSTILLIDDAPRMDALVGMCLGDHVKVIQVERLDEALAAVQLDRPDVVLLDLRLGSKNGLDMLPALRAEPVLEGVPILVFTVHDHMRGEASRMGADGFIAKPFDADDFREKLGTYVGAV